MKIFLCCSNGWDNASTEIWRAYTKEDDAKQWVSQVKVLSNKWNGCNFDKDIRKEYESGLMKLGMIEDGKYNDAYAGSPYYIEVELLDQQFPLKVEQ